MVSNSWSMTASPSKCGAGLPTNRAFTETFPLLLLGVVFCKEEKEEDFLSF
jgi:hypothetical protein